MPRKRKVHLRIYGGCVSFVPACTLGWCYDTNLWHADRTDEPSEVTCKKCLKRIKEWDDESALGEKK